jgi:hypothetical protein
MGLLDNLYLSQSANFGGQGGGLLDFLNRTQEQNGYQPGAGFDQPGQQQAASPIPVGGYQMPRVGQMADFTPPPPQQNAILPQNAQPAQGQLPPGGLPQPQQEAAQALPPAFGGGSALGRMFNPDGLVARLTGNDSRSVAQQNLKAQYDALVPMLGQQKAMLAVLNPEAGKTLINEALTNKEKYGQTGEDSFGNKTFGFINEREQTINGKAVGGGNGDGGGSGTDGGGGPSGFLAPGVKQIDST